jgi:hypothetical protein
MPSFDLQVPHVADAGITIDGDASEPAWAQALVIDQFVTFSPQFDKVPAGATTCRVIADDHGIYFQFHAVDPEPDKIRSSMGRRDTRFGDDWVAVYLDPAGEAQRSYLFVTNALGIQMDGTNISGAPEDMSWDGRWQSGARRTPDGYDAEIGVPWRAVRHPVTADDLGLFVFRKVARTGEKSSWPRLDPKVNGLIAQEAIVGGPGALPKTVGLDLIPELTFDWRDTGPSTDRLGWEGLSPGLTARYSPAPALQVLGTFNPDFSQVESDSSQIGVNRRYALYFEEKRPFFLEGQEWFSHPFDDLVYTRSMVAPLYGARATAEAGGWTVAALNVLDQHPGPTVAELGGWTETDVDGHRAEETVARVRKAIGQDRFVGAVFSDRTILGTNLYNRVGGFDGHVRLTDAWSASAAVLGSSTAAAGVGTAIAPAATAYSGIGNETFEVEGWGNYVAPDFRAENGFVTQTDLAGGGGQLAISLYPKSATIPQLRIVPSFVDYKVTTAGVPRELGIGPHAEAVFGNGVDAWVDYTHGGERFAGAWLSTDSVEIGAEGPWLPWLNAGAGANTGTAAWYDPLAPAIGVQQDVWTEIGLQPLPQLSATASAYYERFLLGGDVAYAGWIGRLRLETYPTRHLWARAILDRSTFEHTLRGEALVAWELSPGTAVYLGGVRGGADPLAKPTPDVPASWEVFAKGSWVIAI